MTILNLFHLKKLMCYTFKHCSFNQRSLNFSDNFHIIILVCLRLHSSTELLHLTFIGTLCSINSSISKLMSSGSDGGAGGTGRQIPSLFWNH